MGGTQARIQDFLKGGGGEDIHKPPPPLGHCPRDVIRPPKNWKPPPLLDIHKHPPPPWTLPCPRVTSSTFQGGGDRCRSRTLCIGFQYRDKFKGGGVIIPVTVTPSPPPLNSDPRLRATAELYIGYWQYVMHYTVTVYSVKSGDDILDLQYTVDW